MPEPFLIDVYGQFSPGRLRIEWHDERRPPDPDLDALVARVWKEQTNASRRAGAVLFNGQLARYLRHRVADGILSIDVGPTDYANFLATNLLNHSRGQEWGWQLFSNPIGTSALPVTSDGFLLLGRRSERVAFHAGHVHAFGGGLEAGERRADNTIDAFASIRRELHEELALGPEDVREIRCMGLIRDAVIRQPELVFGVVLGLTREETAGRLDSDDPHQEHVAILACPDAPQAILPFIRSNPPVTPVAMGALCLHVRCHFGEASYSHIVQAVSA